MRKKITNQGHLKVSRRKLNNKKNVYLPVFSVHIGTRETISCLNYSKLVRFVLALLARVFLRKLEIHISVYEIVTDRNNENGLKYKITFKFIYFPFSKTRVHVDQHFFVHI